MWPWLPQASIGSSTATMLLCKCPQSLFPVPCVGTVPTVVGGAVRGEPVCSTPKLLSNAYRQTQLSHSWGKIFLRRPCTSSSLPSEKAGWLSLSLLLYCQIAGGLAEVTGNQFFFLLLFENVSLKHKTRMFGAKFLKFPRCWCVSSLPTKQFTPLLQHREGLSFLEADKWRNKGGEESCPGRQLLIAGEAGSGRLTDAPCWVGYAVLSLLWSGPAMAVRKEQRDFRFNRHSPVEIKCRFCVEEEYRPEVIT